MLTLVLLPGMDGTGALFSTFVGALPDDTETIVIRYPVDEIMDYAALEDFVRKHLPTDRPYTLLAESFSGPIALSIAAGRPAGLKRLILCCTFAASPRPWFRFLAPLVGHVSIRRVPKRVLCHLLMGRFRTRDLAAKLASAMASVQPSVLSHRAASAATVDVTNCLKDIDIPTLYLQASRDAMVPPCATRVIKKRLPQLRIEQIEGPHFLLQCRSDAAAAAVVDFVIQPLTNA